MVETLVLSIVVGRHESRNAQKEKALSRRGALHPVIFCDMTRILLTDRTSYDTISLYFTTMKGCDCRGKNHSSSGGAHCRDRLKD